MKNNYGKHYVPLLKRTKRIMKIASLCNLLAVCSVSAASYAQELTYSINKQNSTMIEVFKEIEKNSDFTFFYNDNNINVNQEVSVSATNAPIEEILSEVLENTNYSYRIIDKQILIQVSDSEKTSVTGVTQNKRKITGKVLDASGMPIIGANVIEKGTSSNGTITDLDGNFSLEVGEGAVLDISYIGYISQTVKIGNKKNLAITLKEDTKTLDEVVVVGYGTQKKESLTGALATVKTDDLVKVPTASVSQTLAGKLPGLIVKDATGKPGSTPSINIRGFGSPLVIVDGIEQGGYQNIDPNEIASFTILKDAAAAVYGSRAGNGVILITTNRGKEGKTKVSFNSSISAQTPNIWPEFVDSWEYAIIQNEARAWSGQPPMFTEEEIQKFKDGTDPNYPNVDHYSEIIKKWSLMENVNLNVSGGSDKVKFFMSLGFMNQDGIYKSNDVTFKRYNLRSNVDAKVSDNLSIGLDISARITDNNDVPFTSRDIFGVIGTTCNRYPSHYPDPTKIPFVGRNAISPISRTSRDWSGYDDTNQDYLTASLNLKYNVPFIKGLSLQAKGYFISSKVSQKTWTKPYSTYYYDYDSGNYTLAATGGKYSLTRKNTQSQNLTFQGLVEYENTFNDHSIKALFVSEVIDTKSNWFNGYREGFMSDAIDEMFAGSSVNMSTNGSASVESRASFVGRLNYAYKSKYLAEVTARYDASSRFAKESRWGFFPSVSVGWRISEENFIKDKFSNIDNMKLRLSYTHTGYDSNASPYQYLTSYEIKSQYAFGDNLYNTLRSKGLANYNISWEDIHLYNLGYDLDMWRGLLGVEFDVFYRIRDNVLGTRSSSLPTTIGVTLPQENLNKIDNRGFEFVLKHQNTIGDFHYNISSNISWSRSKYVEFDEQIYTDPDEDRLYRKEGKWTDIVYGYKTDGMFQSEEEIKNSDIDYDLKGNSTIKPGMVKYVDVNDDKKIDWRDQVELGTGGVPKIMYGLNLSCDYKAFDLSMLFQGAAQFNIQFDDNMRNLSINSVWNSYKYMYDQRWTPENPDAIFPGTTNGINQYNTKNSDIWYKSAAYCRLKNITLGYTMPSKLIKKIGISRLRFYLSGYNLLTFDKLSKYQQDPEAGASLEYPLYKSVSFGFNVEL